MKRYTGKPNTGGNPRRGERLKADDIVNMQRSIADMQQAGGSPLGQAIELVRLTGDLATGDTVDGVLQGFDVGTEEFTDIGPHALRSVHNPYTGVTFSEDDKIAVVRVGGAVIPLTGGGGVSGITDLRLSGNNFQYFKDGVWTTWTTGASC